MKTVIFSILLLTSAHATSFLLVRHGETDWNKEKIWYGTSDVSLNETGRNQATILAESLKTRQFDQCYASHLIRAGETAAILTTLPVQIDERLRERSSKHFEKLPYGTPARGIKKEYEDPALVSARVFECLEEIATRHKGQTILIATHGGIIKQILTDLLYPNLPTPPIKVPNTATLELEFEDGQWRVKEMQNITLPPQ